MDEVAAGDRSHALGKMGAGLGRAGKWWAQACDNPAPWVLPLRTPTF